MFRVEVTDRARDDADEAFAHLAENVSPEFAATWYQGLFEQVETLIRLPARCPVAAESHKFADEIREMIYGKRRHKHKYRILFSIRDDLVSVLAIQHTARGEFEPRSDPAGGIVSRRGTFSISAETNRPGVTQPGPKERSYLGRSRGAGGSG